MYLKKKGWFFVYLKNDLSLFSSLDDHLFPFPSEARPQGRADLGIGLAKKKVNKKKGTATKLVPCGDKKNPQK